MALARSFWFHCLCPPSKLQLCNQVLEAPWVSQSFLQYLFCRVINSFKWPAHFLDLPRLWRVVFPGKHSCFLSFPLALTCNTAEKKQTNKTRESWVYQSMPMVSSSEIKNKWITLLEVEHLLLLQVHLCRGYQGNWETRTTKLATSVVLKHIRNCNPVSPLFCKDVSVILFF